MTRLPKFWHIEMIWNNQPKRYIPLSINYNMVVKTERRFRKKIVTHIDPKLHKILFYIKRQYKFPTARLLDFALLYLFTEHFDVVKNGQYFIDPVIDSNPELKKKITELLELAEKSTEKNNMGGQASRYEDTGHEHL